jgi:transcription elongation GreA/GreB family factor
MPIAISRPVTVKAIVTPELKRQLAADLQSALARLDAEIGQLEAAGDRAASAAADINKRQQQREQIVARMRELARLEEGQEIVQGTVDGIAQVRPGDEWARLLSAEIVLKDGRVVAVRE